ncbi:MAG: flippase [Gaiellales bacterium]
MSDTLAAAAQPTRHLEGEHGDTASEVVGLARGGIVNLLGALLSHAAAFLVTALLARQLGARAVGLYAQAFAFLALIEILSLSGFRSGLTRFVAVHLADNDRASLRGTIRMGLGFAGLLSAALGAALFFSAPWLAAKAFDEPSLELLFRFVAFTLPFTVLKQAALSATQGYKTMRYFAGIGLLAVPSLRLVATGVFLVAGGGLEGVMAALLISEAFGGVLSIVALRSLVGRFEVRPRYQRRELLGYSTVSWISSIAATGLMWADTILLGVYRSSAEVGRYQVASRLVLIATIALWPMTASFAPRIADLHRRGQTESLRRTYTAATSWILRISLPGFVLLLAFPRELTRLFGNAFTVSAAFMALLMVGKVVDAATGPCGLMLNQSGWVILNMFDNVLGLAVNVALNIYLIPRHGMVGCAVASTLSLVLVNVTRVMQVWIKMRMLPFDPASTKGVAAAVAALGAGLVVHTTLPGTRSLLIGIPTVAAAYLLGLIIFGLSREDRLVLREFRRAWRWSGSWRPKPVPVVARIDSGGPQ